MKHRHALGLVAIVMVLALLCGCSRKTVPSKTTYDEREIRLMREESRAMGY
jgi:hypothetical protein